MKHRILYYILLTTVHMNFQQTYQLKSSTTLRNRMHNCESFRMEERPYQYTSPSYVKTKTITNELESFRTYKFKKQNQVIHGIPMESHPKLEYLRNWKPQKTLTFQNRFIKTQNNLSLLSLESSSLSECFKDDQVLNKKPYQIRKDTLIDDQDYNQQIQPQKQTFSQQILPKSMILLPLGKTYHEVTFNMQSMEIQQDKQSSSTSQSDNNILQYNTTTNKHLDHNNSNTYSNLKKKLAEQQIQTQEQLYRSLIRSSSREGNVYNKQQLKNKMKLVIDKIYSLKQLLKT